jgi:hypothetical protein
MKTTGTTLISSVTNWAVERYTVPYSLGDEMVTSHQEGMG